MDMKWYGLYRDGELVKVIKWYGEPKQSDFSVGGLIGATYEVKEVAVVEMKQIMAMNLLSELSRV